MPVHFRAKMRDDEGDVESPRQHCFHANALEQTVPPAKPPRMVTSVPPNNQLRVSPAWACFEFEGGMYVSSLG